MITSCLPDFYYMPKEVVLYFPFIYNGDVIGGKVVVAYFIYR